MLLKRYKHKRASLLQGKRKMGAGTVIIGAGHGAGQAAASLRQLGYKEPITLLGDEDYPPYQRPPLSKAWLAGEQSVQDILFKPEIFWEQNGIAIRTGCPVTAIDRSAREVVCADGTRLPWAHLVIATGGHARRLQCPGGDLPGVQVLRTLADATALSKAMQEGRRLAIVGGGYVGLEVAATARKRGLEVTVLEAEERVLARVAGEAVSRFFEALHRNHGVTIRTGALAQGFDGGTRLAGVRLDERQVLPADLALVGIGLVPNDDLAAAAGLACDNGIVVDAYCRTEDPDIYAIGDVTRHPSALYGRSLRLESVHNALEQAKTAAMAIMGREKPYDQVPWFWSDQYDVKLQIAGISQGYDETLLRGAPDNNSFAVFYFRKGALIACDAINAPPEYMAARMMIARGKTPDRARLADPGVPMKEIMAGAS